MKGCIWIDLAGNMEITEGAPPGALLIARGVYLGNNNEDDLHDHAPARAWGVRRVYYTQGLYAYIAPARVWGELVPISSREEKVLCLAPARVWGEPCPHKPAFASTRRCNSGKSSRNRLSMAGVLSPVGVFRLGFW